MNPGQMPEDSAVGKENMEFVSPELSTTLQTGLVSDTPAAAPDAANSQS